LTAADSADDKSSVLMSTQGLNSSNLLHSILRAVKG